jgi:transposase
MLSPWMVRILEDLAQDWRGLDERNEGVTSKIDALSKRTYACRHFMTIPNIGQIIQAPWSRRSA